MGCGLEEAAAEGAGRVEAPISGGTSLSGSGSSGSDKGKTCTPGFFVECGTAQPSDLHTVAGYGYSAQLAAICAISFVALCALSSLARVFAPSVLDTLHQTRLPLDMVCINPERSGDQSWFDVYAPLTLSHSQRHRAWEKLSFSCGTLQ